MNEVAPVLGGDGICLFGRKGMEPVRLEKTEVSEAEHATNMRFRFAGQGREFTKRWAKRRFP